MHDSATYDWMDWNLIYSIQQFPFFNVWYQFKRNVISIISGFYANQRIPFNIFDCSIFIEYFIVKTFVIQNGISWLPSLFESDILWAFFFIFFFLHVFGFSFYFQLFQFSNTYALEIVDQQLMILHNVPLDGFISDECWL